MNFAAGCRWVLVAGILAADRPCQAKPPVPQGSSAVKGFDGAVPSASVPGFGGAAQAPASAEASRNQAGHNARDAKDSASKETGEPAAKVAKTPPQPKSYRTRSPYERSSFPSGVPEWFKQRDTNFDGQVFMSEYASSWTDEAARTFSRLDANGDGVITAQESLVRRDVEVKSTTGFAGVRRSSTAASVTRTPVVESSAESVAARLPSAEQAQAAAPRAPKSDAPPPSPDSIPQAFVSYADGVIKRFDADRDGVLTAEEWTVIPAAPATADADGNGQITTNELAIWYVMKR